MATITLDEVKTTYVVAKTEMYDPDVMDAILMDKSFSHKSLRALAEYRKNRKAGNKVSVTYGLGKGYDESKLGRLYPINNVGLQGFPRDIRSPLLEKFYFDVDIENAHYNLMLKMSEKKGYVCTSIRQYVENREAELLKLSKDRRVAKTSFLKVAFGGNVKLYNDQYEDVGLPEGDTTLLRAIEKEVKNIADNVYNANPDFHKLVKKKTNPQFSLFALILQTEERKCLMAMDKFLTTKHRSMDIFIHDGGCVRKLPDEDVFPQELLSGMEGAVLSLLDYKVKIIVKPFQHDFVIPDQNLLDPSVLINDAYASHRFIELCGDNILFALERIFLYNTTTGIWSCKEAELKSAIAGSKSRLVFKQLTSLGTVMTYDYSGSVKNVDKLVTMLPSILKSAYPEKCNDAFLEDGKEKALNKILFKNGIYNFQTNVLIPFDRSIVFTAGVPLMFVENVVKEDRDFVFNTLFRNPFRNITNADIFLHHLMRGMIGDYRSKKFLAMVGRKDTSKGVLTTAFQSWFGGIIGIFGANSLLFRQNTDPLKDLAFLMPVADCRLIFSSEVKPGQTLSTELVKGISSGGDTLIGRRLYQNEEHFVNRAKVVMMCNDFPKVSPPDPDIGGRLVPIHYDFSFQDVVTDSFHEKQSDPTLKPKFTTGDGVQQYGMAMFHIFIETYKAWSDRDFKEPKLSQEIEAFKNELVPKDELKEAINEKYIVTKDENDCVPFADIFNYLTIEKKLTYSKTYIGRELTNMRVGIKEKKVKRKLVSFRTHIKIDPEWVKEEEQEMERMAYRD
jgi:hypothetical protein